MITEIQRKNIIVYAVLFLFSSSFFFASADNSTDRELCFLKLRIKETLKNYDQVVKDPDTKIDVTFSLISQESYYGKEYPLEEYTTGQFFGSHILNTYDAENAVIKKYSVYTSLFISNFSGEGEILKEAVINAVIPYDEKINKITISNSSAETDLKINSSLIKCERTCKMENEKGNYLKDNCCMDFIPATQKDDTFICIKCGDNICSRYEDKYSCPEDCSLKSIADPVSPKDGKNWIWIVAFSIVFILTAVLAGIFIVKKVARAKDRDGSENIL